MLGYTITQWLFGILSFLSIMFALMVVFSRNPVNSILYLVLTFFCIAGLYLLLNAQFLAVVHIVVYSGAIMVLFLFVIMLMNLNQDNEPQRATLNKIIAGVSGGMLLVVLVGSLKGGEQLGLQSYGSSQIGLVKNLGKVLFSEFLFPFEIASILLLAALVGSIMIGKKEIK
ncbi:NADH-quinone oxidoreductase subunit J [Sediminibacterium sp.]|uniref:NADH-quinone oxidoreductase subunit J family protein n=1 Tax=Sediminibacterium sp. TaxID=1917865 RepID=UPI002721D267|nr:NADH-quinone oxidoreductase subunit J [Sediminibacterium sp.]MDO9000604.1 NADH-quinone oxidoreductase subunit J [Bacteroidota bacterium]MDP3146828.1 NADH-quinone oxidoreductase subunit J [Bacteroidota bacterium]MDP3567626.1 NADH-quinone oxidoreductase subunit J [Sediminibacterium sp.]